MPVTGKALSQRNSPEEIINLLFNTGFRLTGNNQVTAELVKGALDTLSGQKVNFNTAVKGLCSVYINTTAKKSGSMLHNESGTKKVQEALLSLPNKERLVVVLCEVLGLDYAEIADMTGLEETAVISLLAAGRWSLRKQLIPLSPRQELAEKGIMVK